MHAVGGVLSRLVVIRPLQVMIQSLDNAHELLDQAISAALVSEWCWPMQRAQLLLLGGSLCTAALACSACTEANSALPA